MIKPLILDAEAIRQNIWDRVERINKHNKTGDRVTLAGVLTEANTSIHTFYGWGRKGSNYSLAKVKAIDEVLDRYEADDAKA